MAQPFNVGDQVTVALNPLAPGTTYPATITGVVFDTMQLTWRVYFDATAATDPDGVSVYSEPGNLPLPYNPVITFVSAGGGGVIDCADVAGCISGANPASCDAVMGCVGTHLNGGICFDPIDSNIGVCISADPGNVATFGGDSGIFVPAVAGPAGPAGPQGATGPAGAAGATGPQGIQGTPGATGPTGATGPQGNNGLDGASVTIEGSVTDPGALPACTAGTAGQGYLIATGNPGAGDLYVCDGTGYQNVGNIQGPAGPTGPTGATGATGPQGDPGPAGATGATGPAGADGAAGAQGIQGVAGTPGATGPAGPAGPTVVSADANNISVLGTDGFVYTPPLSAQLTDPAQCTAVMTCVGSHTVDGICVTPAGDLGLCLSTDAGNQARFGTDGGLMVDARVTAGTGVTVTGDGTTATPYVVSSAAAPVATTRWVAGNVATATPSIGVEAILVPNTTFTVVAGRRYTIVTHAASAIGAGSQTFHRIRGQAGASANVASTLLAIARASGVNPVHMGLETRALLGGTDLPVGQYTVILTMLNTSAGAAPSFDQGIPPYLDVYEYAV